MTVPHDRRAFAGPSDRRKLDPIWRGLLLAALLAFLAWAAKPLVPVSAARFEADSSRRDRQRAADSTVLNRIDSRVGEMYCGGLPENLRSGCR